MSRSGNGSGGGGSSSSSVLQSDPQGQAGEDPLALPANWAAESAFCDGLCHKRGLVNVMDPIVPKGNLSRPVDQAGLRAITAGLRGGYKAYLQLCDDFKAHGKADEITADLISMR